MECYGTYFAYSKIDEFHHGISSQMLFEGFRQTFCAPTSTTLQWSVAVTFANQAGDNGMIITLRNDKLAASFFNCISFSDFGHESEMLLWFSLSCVVAHEFCCAEKLVPQKN